MPFTTDTMRVTGLLQHANQFSPGISASNLAQRDEQEYVVDLASLVRLEGAGNTAGIGITGTADNFVTSVNKVGSIIKTTILIDVDGLNSGGSADDVIGADGAGVAHLGQITAAVNGTIFAGTITCLQTPTGGDPDIDLWYTDDATGVEDTLVTTMNNQIQCINHGDWTAGQVDGLTAFPPTTKYLYLATGDFTDATYTAGILLIELWGTAANDLSVVLGAFGTNSVSLQTANLRAEGATSNYARFEVRLPPNYVAGQTVKLRVSAGMLTTIADATATLDLVCHQLDEDTTVQADIVETVAQSINNLVFADFDFTIAPGLLSPGDILDCRLVTAVNDASTSAAVIACVAAIKLVCDTKG